MFTTALYNNGIKYEWGKHQRWPWSHTVAYRPLNKTTKNLDKSPTTPKYDMGYETAIWWYDNYVSVNNSYSVRYTYQTSTPITLQSNWTICLWHYNNNGSISRVWVLNIENGSPILWIRHTTSWYQINVNWTETTLTNEKMPEYWKWFMYVITVSWTSYNIYIIWNGTDIKYSTTSWWIWWKTLGIFPGAYYNYWTSSGYVSNVIIEDIAWTDKEIKSYYDQTKATYWL